MSTTTTRKPRKTFVAKYPGRCRACGLDITPGEKIKWFGPRDTEHVDCPREYDAETASEAQYFNLIDPGHLNDVRFGTDCPF